MATAGRNKMTAYALTQQFRSAYGHGPQFAREVLVLAWINSASAQGSTISPDRIKMFRDNFNSSVIEGRAPATTWSQTAVGWLKDGIEVVLGSERYKDSKRFFEPLIRRLFKSADVNIAGLEGSRAEESTAAMGLVAAAIVQEEFEEFVKNLPKSSNLAASANAAWAAALTVDFGKLDIATQDDLKKYLPPAVRQSIQPDGSCTLTPEIQRTLNDEVLDAIKIVEKSNQEQTQLLREIDAGQKSIQAWLEAEKERQKAAENQAKLQESWTSERQVATSILDSTAGFIALFDPKAGQAIATVGQAYLQISGALEKYTSNVANLGALEIPMKLDKATMIGQKFASAAVLASTIVGAGLAIINLLLDTGPSIEERIWDKVEELQKDVQELRVAMDDHFRRLHVGLAESFANVADNFTAIRLDLSNLSTDIRNVQDSLYRLNTDIKRLASYVLNLEQVASLMELQTAVNGVLPLLGGEMTMIEFRRLENVLHSWATIHASNPLHAGTGPDGGSTTSASQLLNVPSADQYINFIFHWADQNVPTVHGVKLPNGAVWYLAAYGYLYLLRGWPNLSVDLFGQMASGRHLEVRAAGERLRAGLVALTRIESSPKPSKDDSSDSANEVVEKINLQLPPEVVDGLLGLSPPGFLKTEGGDIDKTNKSFAANTPLLEHIVAAYLLALESLEAEAGSKTTQRLDEFSANALTKRGQLTASLVIMMNGWPAPENIVASIPDAWVIARAAGLYGDRPLVVNPAFTWTEVGISPPQGAAGHFVKGRVSARLWIGLDVCLGENQIGNVFVVAPEKTTVTSPSTSHDTSKYKELLGDARACAEQNWQEGWDLKSILESQPVQWAMKLDAMDLAEIRRVVYAQNDANMSALLANSERMHSLDGALAILRLLVRLGLPATWDTDEYLRFLLEHPNGIPTSLTLGNAAATELIKPLPQRLPVFDVFSGRAKAGIASARERLNQHIERVALFPEIPEFVSRMIRDLRIVEGGIITWSDTNLHLGAAVESRGTPRSGAAVVAGPIPIGDYVSDGYTDIGDPVQGSRRWFRLKFEDRFVWVSECDIELD